MKTIKILLLCLFLTVIGHTQSFGSEIRTSGDLLNAVAEAKEKQVVIINFYASWCGPCREEIPHLIEIRKQFPKDKLKIIAINLDDSKETMQAFNKKAGINYESHHDGTGDIQQFFGIQSIPFNLVYSKNGKAIYASPGTINQKRLTEIIEYGLNN